MHWYSVVLICFLLLSPARGVHARSSEDPKVLTLELLKTSWDAGILKTAEQVKAQILARIAADNIVLAEFMSQHPDREKIKPLWDRMQQLESEIKKRIARMDELGALIQAHQDRLDGVAQSELSDKQVAEIKAIAGHIEALHDELEKIAALHQEKDRAYREMYETFIDRSHPVYNEFQKCWDELVAKEAELKESARRSTDLAAERRSAKEHADRWAADLFAKRDQLNSDIAECNVTVAEQRAAVLEYRASGGDRQKLARLRRESGDCKACMKRRKAELAEQVSEYKEFLKRDDGPSQEAAQLVRDLELMIAERDRLYDRSEQLLSEARVEAERLKKAAEVEMQALREEYNTFGSESARGRIINALAAGQYETAIAALNENCRGAEGGLAKICVLGYRWVELGAQKDSSAAQIAITQLKRGLQAAETEYLELWNQNQPPIEEYKKLKPKYLDLTAEVERHSKSSKDQAKTRTAALVSQALEDEVALLKAILGDGESSPDAETRLGEMRAKLRGVGITESIYGALAEKGKSHAPLDLPIEFAQSSERPVPQHKVADVLGRWFRLIEEEASAPVLSETIETILNKTVLGQVKPQGYGALAACQAFVIGFDAAGYRLVECFDEKSQEVLSYGIIKPNATQVYAYVSPSGVLVDSRQSIIDYVAGFELQGVNLEAPGSADLVAALARLKDYAQSLDLALLSSDQTERLVVAVGYLDAAAALSQDVRFTDDSGDYEKWVSLALMAVDFAIGLTPADPLVQLYGFIEGKDLLTGENLSEDERLLRGVLVIAGVFPGGKYFVAGVRVLGSKISKHGVVFLKRVRAGRFVRSSAPEKARGIVESATTIRTKISNVGEAIPGTTIPKYFRLKSGGEEFFVNPNATKHMGEYINHIPTSHGSPLRNDLILASFESGVQDAVKSGAWRTSLESGKPIVSGGWELIFARRPSDELVVIKHALMK